MSMSWSVTTSHLSWYNMSGYFQIEYTKFTREILYNHFKKRIKDSVKYAVEIADYGNFILFLNEI